MAVSIGVQRDCAGWFFELAKEKRVLRPFRHAHLAARRASGAPWQSRRLRLPLRSDTAIAMVPAALEPRSAVLRFGVRHSRRGASGVRGPRVPANPSREESRMSTTQPATTSTIRALLALTAALGAPACMIDDELDDDQLGTAESEVNAGTVIPAAGSGFVSFGTSVGGCSGTLVRNNFVLTAKHCFSAADVAAPGSITVSMGAQLVSAAEIIHYPADDVTLMRLAAPLTMNGSTTGFERSLYPFATNTLAPNTMLTCRGYGLNDLNQPSDGLLRTAELPVRGVNFTWWFDHYDLGVNVNSQGQFLTPGDSGGSCLFTMPGGEQVLAGVTSTLYRELDATFNGLISAQTFRAWYVGQLPPAWSQIGHANWIAGMAGSTGKLFAATTDSQLWSRSPVGMNVTWTSFGHANGVVAMTAIGPTLFAITSDNKLWSRAAVEVNVNWTLDSTVSNLIAIAGIGDKLFAVNTSSQLLWRYVSGANTSWTMIGHAYNVVSMAAVNDKLYCVTTDDQLWRRDPVLWNVNWTSLGATADIVELAAVNGKLFAATSDNRLLWRDVEL
jgi:hypothetical protein